MPILTFSPVQIIISHPLHIPQLYDKTLIVRQLAGYASRTARSKQSKKDRLGDNNIFISVLTKISSNQCVSVFKTKFFGFCKKSDQIFSQKRAKFIEWYCEICDKPGLITLF